MDLRQLPLNPNTPIIDILRVVNELVRGLRILEYFVPLSSAPTTVTEGMLVFADGTNWDPGSGSGFYAYKSGAWSYLGSVGGGSWPGFNDAQGDPSPVGTASDGVSAYPSRRDHTHSGSFNNLTDVPTAFVPEDHAGTHVTGGGDVIANAVAGGNAGLMSGSDKSKLDGIATGAEVNVNADWNSSSGDSQILNKPTAFVPEDHAGSHVTGGGDVIANAVAGGNAGLMSGSDKSKLDGIAAGAEVNVNADWNSSSGDSQILNKPTIPSQIVFTAKQSSQVTNSSNTTPSDIPGLSFSVVNGHRYYFRFCVTFQTAATTTGVGFVFSNPAMTSESWRVDIRQAAAGTDSFYQNFATSLSTVLVNASVVAANADYIAVIEGFCQPSADGTLQLQTRSEVNLSQITIKNTGVGFLVDAG